ncbi:MAG: hypothetical protein OQK69_07490 [Gammaproteobacteria bacterium]|nr:hypothetical protein [Gammaproteobacteria bacterium]
MLLSAKVLSDGLIVKKNQKKDRRGCRSKGELLKVICQMAARAITTSIFNMKMAKKIMKKTNNATNSYYDNDSHLEYNTD